MLLAIHVRAAVVSLGVPLHNGFFFGCLHDLLLGPALQLMGYHAYSLLGQEYLYRRVATTHDLNAILFPPSLENTVRCCCLGDFKALGSLYLRFSQVHAFVLGGGGFIISNIQYK